MNELQRVFEYQGNTVRTVLKDGELLFIAKDVCDALGIQNVAVERFGLENDEIQKLYIPEFSNTYTLVNESGLYTLIIRSSKPEAKKFRKWVTSEVLPSIRKTGQYGIQPQYKLPQTHAETLRMLADTVEQVENQKKALAEAQPKVEAFDHFIEGVNCKSVARVAQEIGTGQNTLFAFLRGYEYLFAGGERHNLPYQTYIDRGFFTVKTTPVKMGEKFVNVSQTLITPKGQTHIAELWRNAVREAA